MCNHQRSIGQISVESGNKTKEGKLAAEFVSFEIAYPCFIKAVISIPLINFTNINFLGTLKACQTLIVVSSILYFIIVC